MAEIESPVISEAAASAAQAVFTDPLVRKALEFIEQEQDRRVEEQASLAEIPSPPFKEDLRRASFIERIRSYGLRDAHLDGLGNVIALRRGKNPDAPKLVVGAHLDSVFPEGTVCKVTRDENGVLHCPGISDDTRGLASLLQTVRALETFGIETEGDVVFLGILGEEGLGDLRGTKFFWKEHPNDFDGFLGIDFACVSHILKGSTGSERFLVSFDGPGGHSYGKFGEAASAIHALCIAGSNIARLKVSASPKTTFTIGTVKGGTSVNAIAAHAEMELDVRSTDQREIDRLVSEIKKIIASAAEEENAIWGVTGDAAVRCDVKQIGARPAAMSEADSPVIQACRTAQMSLGIELDKFFCASGDQNVPLSMGIPSSTIGGGGIDGGTHTLNEWWNPEKAWLGPQLLLLSILTLSGVAGVTKPLLQKRN